MSTRSVIARPEGDGFAGRYAHWDGYPTCRAAQLWQSYLELGGDIEALRAYAIKEGHKGYWSSYQPPAKAESLVGLPDTIECDLCNGTGIRPDYKERGFLRGCNACGGSVSGTAKKGTGRIPNPAKQDGWNSENSDNWVTSYGDDMGTEWAYVLADKALVVFERRFGQPQGDQGHGTGMFGYGASDTESGGYWKLVYTAPWGESEPDWEAVEGSCNEEVQV